MVPGIVRSCKAVTPTARFTEGLCGCPSLLMLEIRYTLLLWVVLPPRSATGLQLVWLTCTPPAHGLVLRLRLLRSTRTRRMTRTLHLQAP